MVTMLQMFPFSPTVLVVDDDHALLRATTRMLRAIGLQVIPCDTVDEAVGRMLDCDVVLSDYDMPDGGGPRMLAEAKRAGKPLTFHSGSTGIDHPYVVKKPATLDELQDGLLRAMAEQ